MLISEVKPAWTSRDGRAILYCGDAAKVTKSLKTRSVHVAVTSPPYWGQRVYGFQQSGLEIGHEANEFLYAEAVADALSPLLNTLRDDGTLWLNLGDVRLENGMGMAGIPWLVVTAMRRYGWVVEQEIIWHKPSPMPSGNETRCTTAHEFLFMLSKGAEYYYDPEPLKVQSEYDLRVMSNRRSVWTIPSQPYPGAHFACFPEELARLCIVAGASLRGCCPRCGSPYTRLVEKEKLYRERPNDLTKRTGEKGTGNFCPNTVAGTKVITIGWRKMCTCLTYTSYEGIDRRLIAGPAPCTVFDPFVGSGTTVAVAASLGMVGIGIDASEEYIKALAVPRVVDAIGRGARMPDDPLRPSRAFDV